MGRTPLTISGGSDAATGVPRYGATSAAVLRGRDRRITAERGTLILAGQAVTLARGKRLLAATGSLALVGRAAAEVQVVHDEAHGLDEAQRLGLVSRVAPTEGLPALLAEYGRARMEEEGRRRFVVVNPALYAG